MRRAALTVLLAVIAAVFVAATHRGVAAPTSTSGSPPAWVGHTVLLQVRSKSSGCRRGALPDRRCSPGAFYTGLTKGRLCSSSFRTSTIRDVSEGEKQAVEVEYGMAPRGYGHTVEIDHLIPLELGGSNAIPNLFPEPGSGDANFHEKDTLENRAASLVCSGRISLRTVQRQIASDWIALYRRVFARTP